MKKRNLSAGVILCIALLTSVSSCVDESYNLNKLNKDNIFSPNGIVVPIGSVDTIFLKKIFENYAIDSLFYDDKGNYYLSYSGSYEPEFPKKSDFSFIPRNQTVHNLAIPNPWGVPETMIPAGTAYDLHIQENMVKYNDFQFNTIEAPWGYAVIDSCNFTHLAIIISVELIDVVTENMQIVLDVTHPDMIGFAENPTVLTFSADVGGIQIDSINVTNYNFADEDFSFLYSVKMQKADINRTANISYQSNPRIRISFYSTPEENIELGVVWGTINIIENSVHVDKFEISLLKTAFPYADFNFYNPSLQIITDGNLGVPLITTLLLAGEKDGIVDTTNPNSTETADNLRLDSPTEPGKEKHNFYYLARQEEDVPNGAIYRNFNINKIIQNKPDFIHYELMVGTDYSVHRPHFIDFTKELKMSIAYKMLLPFSFEEGTSITLSDTITNIFDENLVDLLFYDSEKGGDVIITADAENTFPLDMTVNVAFLREDYTRLAIVVAPITLKKEGDEFKIHIENKYFKFMSEAKHMEVSFTANHNGMQTNDGKPIGLSTMDYILIKKLIFKKTGGLHFELEF